MALPAHLRRYSNLVDLVVEALLRGPEGEEGAPADRQSDRRLDSNEHDQGHGAVGSDPRSDADVRRIAASAANPPRT